MPKSILYTIPKIKSTGDKWFVWFRYRDEKSGKMKLIIKKGGANYSDFNQKEKLSQLQALRKALLYKLEVQGWNPITNTCNVPKERDIDLELLRSMGLNDAIEFALSKCSVATKTKVDYRCTARFFKTAAEHFDIHKKAISDVKRIHVKSMLEHLHKTRSWSNHAYNKNIGNLRAILDRLIEWDILEINPAGKIKTLKKMESEKYVPITKEEKQIIAAYLKEHHFRFFVFLMIIYHTGVRPKEILALKIKDLNVAKFQLKMDKFAY